MEQNLTLKLGKNIKFLENKYIKIYGDLDNTINFRNAKEIITKIYEQFEKPYIITIFYKQSLNYFVFFGRFAPYLERLCFLF